MNPEKTALIGLSWGSWYGAIVTAVDPRFKGIVEIYCGDRRPESNSMINGRFLHAAKVPMYWVCSTNDQNVTPVTLQNAFDACPKTVNQSLVINLPHSHVGFTFPACFRMAGHFLKGETALPVIGKAVVKDGIASAPLLGRGRGIIRTVFCYTTDRNQVKPHLRVWKSIPAELHGNTLSVTLPEGIFQGFFSAYDQESSFHDCCGSGNLLQF